MSLCQLQTCVVETQFGLPKTFRNRDSQRSPSETDVPPGFLLRARPPARHTLTNRLQPAGDVVQRFIPADSLPARIGFGFWTRALQRKIQTIRVIDKLGAAFP